MPMKVKSAINQFLKYAIHLEKKADSTLEHYKTATTRFAGYLSEFYWEDLELSAITLDDMINYAERLDELEVESGFSKRKRKLNHNTKVALITTIKTFFKWCKQCKYDCLEYDLIPIAKQERNELCYLTHSEILAFFDIAQKEKKETIRLRNELFFRVAYFTWLRKWEILNLTFDELLSGHQFQIIQKFKRKRTVFFDDYSKIREIALQLKALYNIKPKHQIHYHEQKDYVFICLNDPKRGKKMERGAANVLLERYREALWIKKKVTIHSFRHSFATTLLERGRDIREVQILLWHATISSTQVYTHIAESKLKESAACLRLD